jgi:transcriptional regulator with XRE-family HTH domain
MPSEMPSRSGGEGRIRLALPYLRAWRYHRIMSQEELAERSGVSKATIVRAERPEQPQTVIASTIRKLADALGVSREDLLYRDPPRAKVKGSA